MPRCQAITRLGGHCRNPCAYEQTRCRVHRPRELCRLCDQPATRGTLCRLHDDEDRVRDQIALGLWDELVLDLENGEDVREVEAELDEAFETGTITRRWYTRFMMELGRFRRAARERRRGPPPVDELAAFVRDSQNVHREPVSAQTNRGLDVLLSVAVPPTQKTLKEIEAAWGKNVRNQKIIDDMKRWYRTKMCRSDDDKLYKRALKGLWALIKSSAHRDELVKRLKEECTDAVKMCCDGHITRLVNVMVGFDDRFEPPVPVKELLQQKMSAIASKDMSVEEKALEAWIVMDDLKIPDGERSAWIDAF
jgi:hypothetical protein